MLAARDCQRQSGLNNKFQRQYSEEMKHLEFWGSELVKQGFSYLVEQKGRPHCGRNFFKTELVLSLEALQKK